MNSPCFWMLLVMMDTAKLASKCTLLMYPGTVRDYF